MIKIIVFCFKLFKNKLIMKKKNVHDGTLSIVDIMFVEQIDAILQEKKRIHHLE